MNIITQLLDKLLEPPEDAKNEALVFVVVFVSVGIIALITLVVWIVRDISAAL
jgi:hypothetical protein